MAVCRATKANGEGCRGTANGSHGYCWAHDPVNAEQRHKATSKAAKSKPSREVKDLKQEAAVMLQGYRVLKDFVELERKLREALEFEERLETLEAVFEDKKGRQA
jgi:flagellar motility protein MotE (MotC chaperone)